MKHRILVLEDNLLNYELLRDWLEGEGYEVVFAENLSAGFVAVREYGPQLVLLDIQLGADNGLLFAKWMNEEPEDRRIPVIAVTAQAMPAERERILESGCKACILKPVDFVLLRKSLKRWLPAGDPARSLPLRISDGGKTTGR